MYEANNTVPVAACLSNVAILSSRNTNTVTLLLPADKLELSLAKPIYSAGLHFSVMITITVVSMKAKPNEAAAQDIYLKPFLRVHSVYQS